MNLVKTTASIIRPANTDQYAIGDVLNADAVGIPIEFSTGYSRNAPVKLVGGQCISSNPAVSPPEIDVLFFKESFAIAADNAAFAPSDANVKNHFLGKMTFDNFEKLANNQVAQTVLQNPVFLYPKSTTDKVYAVPVLKNTYTPVSAEEFTFKFDVVYSF